MAEKAKKQETELGVCYSDLSVKLLIVLSLRLAPMLVPRPFDIVGERAWYTLHMHVPDHHGNPPRGWIIVSIRMPYTKVKYGQLIWMPDNVDSIWGGCILQVL